MTFLLLEYEYSIECRVLEYRNSYEVQGGPKQIDTFSIQVYSTAAFEMSQNDA